MKRNEMKCNQIEQQKPVNSYYGAIYGHIGLQKKNHQREKLFHVLLYVNESRQ